jgi:hypothetical protein
METAIVAALISACVSLVGALVAIHLAKVSRRHENTKRRAEILLSIKKEEMGKIDAFLTACESFRIHIRQATELIKDFHPNDATETSIKSIAGALSAIRPEYKAYVSSWTAIKHLLSSETPHHFAYLLHELGTNAIYFVMLAEDYSAPTSSGNNANGRLHSDTTVGLNRCLRELELETHNLYLSVLAEKQRILIDALESD